MNSRKRFEVWVLILIATVLFWPSTVRFVTGGAGSSLQSAMTFQRTVDTPSPGPFGTIKLVKNANGKQTFNVNVMQLNGQSFGIFLATNNTFDTNLVFFVGSLDLAGEGHWSIDYQANNGAAPPQLPVADLEDMAGLFVFVSNPAGSTNFNNCVTNLTGCSTNVVDCQTNVVDGVTNIVNCVTNLANCVTNIDSCITNVVVSGVLVAEVPALTANASIFSTKGKSLLSLPLAPPSPSAKGMISAKFNAKTGASLLDIRATGLNGGQVYTIFFSTTPGGSTFTNLSLTLIQDGSRYSFKRDTKLGETLPLLASTVTDLSGINIEIRDAFDDVHLSGTIP